MIKKTISYVDYDGVERKEDFYFNLTKAEVMEMELTFEGGLGKYLQKIIDSKDAPQLITIFKDLILKAYGVKSNDGKSFNKVDSEGHKLGIAFSQTEAYSELFTELAVNTEAASEFVNGIMPDMSSFTKTNAIEVSK